MTVWIHLLSPVLGLLGVYIILANSFVIGFYQKKYKETVPWIYIMIAGCDTVTGFTAICHASISITPKYEVAALLEEKVLPSADWLPISVYVILQVVTRTSLFYNTVLTVVRTINIIQPFYQLKKKIMTVFIIFYPILWIVLSAIDVYLIVHYSGSVSVMYSVFGIYPGLGFTNLESVMVPIDKIEPQLLFSVTYATYAVVTIFMAIPFVLPAITALVCAVLQINSLLKPSIISLTTIKEKRMTVTIIMLTVACLVCNIPGSVLGFYLLIKLEDGRRLGLPLSQLLCICYSLCTLLPFINAILNPMILVLRGAVLREFVVDTVQFVVDAVRRLFIKRTSVIKNTEETEMEIQYSIANAVANEI